MRNKKILLGSSSKRRIELLKSLDIEFDQYSPEIDESFDTSDPIFFTQEISKRKFMKCKEIFPNSYIITADTVVSFSNKILGKPSSIFEAKEFLKLLSNQTHEVITSVCMGYEYYSFTVASKVEFYPLNDKLLDWYLQTNEWSDKAGAYAIQGFGKIFVRRIIGDYYNIVGLPISKVWNKLLQDKILIF
jgi:septum formation protein